MILDASLAPYTTFGIGGPADVVWNAHNEDDVRAACTYAQERSVPLTVFGGGSNLLVADEGVRGVVLRMGIDGIRFEECGEYVIVRAGAGVVWDDLVHTTVARGLWGFENLSAIPGTVGGSVVQNIGAYGVEVGAYVYEVRVIDRAAPKAPRVLTGSACRFGYRDSLFKHQDGMMYIVTEVAYKLSNVPHPQITYKDLATVFGTRSPAQSEIRDAVVRIRAGKFPDLSRIGTAGSFFKNPVISHSAHEMLRARYPGIPGFPHADGMVKVPVAWILDHVLHMKGVRNGAVGAWDAQPLVLVNYGGASADDVDRFAHMVEDRVRDATGIVLEREVVAVGGVCEKHVTS